MECNVFKATLSFACLASSTAMLAIAPSIQAQQFSKVGPVDTLGSLKMAPNTWSGTKIVADFNGDGVDDILKQSSMSVRIWTGSPFGKDFADHYIGTTEIPPLPPSKPKYSYEIQLANSATPIQFSGSTWKFIAGNFTGSAAAEVLLARDSISLSDKSYFMLNWQGPGKPNLLYDRSGTTVGDAPFNSTFYAVNVTGDSYDELISAESKTFRIQKFYTNAQPHLFATTWSNNGNGWIGGWAMNPGQDVYFFDDFVGNDGVKELLCINRVNGWLKLLKFTGSGWQDLHTNMGNGNFYANPTVGASYPFSAATQIHVGNFDTTDPNIEVLVYPNSAIGFLQSLEFNPATMKFMPVKTPAAFSTIDLAGNWKSPTPAVTAYEMWSDKKCVKKVLGICTKWTGGNYQTPRQFYRSIWQDGAIEVLVGNFSDSYGSNKKKELLVFYNSTDYTPKMPAGAVFYSNCPGSGIYSGACGQFINLYNLMGQQLDTYDVVRDVLLNGSQQRNTQRTILYGSGDF